MALGPKPSFTDPPEPAHRPGLGAATVPVTAKYRLFVFAAAFLFSTGGAAIKTSALTSWQIASFRSGIASAALAVLLPEARRNWTPRTLVLATSYAATMILFVLSTKLTISANAILLQSTAPLYLLLLGPIILHEPPRRVDLLVIAAVFSGAALLLFGAQSTSATAPNPRLGNVLGLCSGIAWALTLTGLRWISKRSGQAESSISVVTVGNLLAFLIALPMALPARHVSPVDLLVLGYLGLFQIALAYTALTYALRFVPGLEAATLLLLEPVFNPIWTWLVHGEKPAAAGIAGGTLIICASLGGGWYDSRAAKLRAGRQ